MDKKAFFSSLERASEEYTFANGETVVLRELSEGDRARLIQKKDDPDLNAYIFVWGCDEFMDMDIPSIRNMPLSAVADVVRVILTLSGMTDDTEAPLDMVEEGKKQSGEMRH